MTNNRGRGIKTYKTFVYIFICLTTRVIHLELSSSLTTSDYNLALRRFLSLHGCPRMIFSDSSTNYVGAQRVLYRFFKTYKKEILNAMVVDKINWRLILPKSPHFGEL